MVREKDLSEAMWVNPFDMDHYDPMNWNNPKNAMYNIAEIIHHANQYLEMHSNNKENINVEEFLKNIDNLASLKQLAMQELQSKKM